MPGIAKIAMKKCVCLRWRNHEDKGHEFATRRALFLPSCEVVSSNSVTDLLWSFFAAFADFPEYKYAFVIRFASLAAFSSSCLRTRNHCMRLRQALCTTLVALSRLTRQRQKIVSVLKMSSVMRLAFHAASLLLVRWCRATAFVFSRLLPCLLPSKDRNTQSNNNTYSNTNNV